MKPTFVDRKGSPPASSDGKRLGASWFAAALHAAYGAVTPHFFGVLNAAIDAGAYRCSLCSRRACNCSFIGTSLDDGYQPAWPETPDHLSPDFAEIIQEALQCLWTPYFKEITGCVERLAYAKENNGVDPVGRDMLLAYAVVQEQDALVPSWRKWLNEFTFLRPDHGISSSRLRVEASHLGLKFWGEDDHRVQIVSLEAVVGEGAHRRGDADGERVVLAAGKTKRRFVNRKASPPACADGEIAGASWQAAMLNARFGKTCPAFLLILRAAHEAGAWRCSDCHKRACQCGNNPQIGGEWPDHLDIEFGAKLQEALKNLDVSFFQDLAYAVDQIAQQLTNGDADPFGIAMLNAYYYAQVYGEVIPSRRLWQEFLFLLRPFHGFARGRLAIEAEHLGLVFRD